VLACRADRAFERAAELMSPILVDRGPRMLDLRAERIGTVIWATGYVRRYPWLRAPVLDRDGELLHRGGVTASPGLYALGLTFMRRRRSHFIDGCGLDAMEIATEIAGLLGCRETAHGADLCPNWEHRSVLCA
jgi:putative flavoprotein involved in K+ transport